MERYFTQPFDLIKEQLQIVHQNLGKAPGNRIALSDTARELRGIAKLIPEHVVVPDLLKFAESLRSAKGPSRDRLTTLEDDVDKYRLKAHSTIRELAPFSMRLIELAKRAWREKDVACLLAWVFGHRHLPLKGEHASEAVWSAVCGHAVTLFPLPVADGRLERFAVCTLYSHGEIQEGYFKRDFDIIRLALDSRPSDLRNRTFENMLNALFKEDKPLYVKYMTRAGGLPSDLVGRSEAATIIGCDEATIDRRKRGGTLTNYGRHGKPLFSRRELETNRNRVYLRKWGKR